MKYDKCCEFCRSHLFLDSVLNEKKISSSGILQHPGMFSVKQSSNTSIPIYEIVIGVEEDGYLFCCEKCYKEYKLIWPQKYFCIKN